MGMTTAIASAASQYIPPIVSTALQSFGLSSSGVTGTSSLPQGDSGQLSPFAQVLNQLQQLQQSSPSQYSQTTAQIATNLQAAAQSATASGNTTLANTLNQLSTDFTSASKNGTLPNVQDLAQAVHHGHHHHHHGGGGASSGSSSTDSSQLAQALAAFQSNSTANPSTDPLQIILNTLGGTGSSSAVN